MASPAPSPSGRRRCFSAWPDIERDDLITESSLAIRKAHPKFNPDYRTLSGKRIAYSTFAYSVAARQLFDIWRALTPNYRRDRLPRIADRAPRTPILTIRPLAAEDQADSGCVTLRATNVYFSLAFIASELSSHDDTG